MRCGVATCVYSVAYTVNAIAMPLFIVWLYISVPPTLIPQDLANLPSNGEAIHFDERYGFVFYGFVYCMFMGFIAQSLTFLPGLVNAVDQPLSGHEFFGRSADVISDGLRQLCAVTAFSVAASEPKSLILRNWVGKLTMASRLKRVGKSSELDIGSFRVAAELADFGSHRMPLLVDAFADEKHSDVTLGLWEAWAAFAASSPDPHFLGKWAGCQEDMSMHEAMTTADPFDPRVLHEDCGLPLDQVAIVLGREAADLQHSYDFLPLPSVAGDVEAALTSTDSTCQGLRLSPKVLEAFVALRREYMEPGVREAQHDRSEDVILEKKFSFHSQSVLMLYVARGKPDEAVTPKIKTRAVAEEHWICLSEAYYTMQQPERHEAKSHFWAWAREALWQEGRSEWETLRTCYARAKRISGNTVELCQLSEGMQRYLDQCPRLPDDARRADFILPLQCVEPYIPARGKAGALNFAVRLLTSRGVLERESLFAIFDARHTPFKKFWYWVLPSFFTSKDDGAFELNRTISFVQAPQKFAKLSGAIDYLDLQNGFFYNVMNQMRNKSGAVTSCGTNAVWLLPGKDDLARGRSHDASWWQNPYFEELTKIEDTATSHRLMAEGKYSTYVNPEGEPPDEDGAHHPACIGVAKQGPDYLAALERWCEGAVQLFWVTMFRGPGRIPCLLIFLYCCCWLAFIIFLLFAQPLIFCNPGSVLSESVCQPFASFYNDWQYNYKRDYDQNEAWKLMAEKSSIQLVESWFWITIGVFTSAAVMRGILNWEMVARYVVMYDNMTNYVSSTTCFYWIFVNVYLVLGMPSPFRYDIAWLCVWFSLLTGCRWTLLYSARSQGNCEGLSFWRSQALWLVNAPGQIMAMIQGSIAAFHILVRQVDKSWWIDPKELVKGLARAWSLIVFLLFPFSVVAVAWSWSNGILVQQQVVSMLLLFYTACQITRPMLYIWDVDFHRWSPARLASGNQGHLSRHRRVRAKSNKSVTYTTTMLRVAIEVLLPISVAVVLLATMPTPPSMLNLTPVARHGWLRVEGTKVIDEYGQPARLSGVSLFWSQWQPEYWNVDAVRWLRDDWNISLVRAAMGVERDVDGYIKYPARERRKVESIVEAAIANGVYVIVDWHVEQIREGTNTTTNGTDHGGHDKVHNASSHTFFAEISKKYGDHPNVLYELWDEPTEESWADEIKPYYEDLVSVIRHGEQAARRRRNPTIAPETKNLIILGTRHYSADVDDASMDMVSGDNLAYALHFYQIAEPKDREWLRVRTWNALSRGAPVFVSEWGSSACDQGSDMIDEHESLLWLSFLEEHNISSANWAISDKTESCSLLRPGASGRGGWPVDQLSPAGTFIRSYMRGELHAPSGGGCAGLICPPCAIFSLNDCMAGNSTLHCGYCEECCSFNETASFASIVPLSGSIHSM